MNTQAWRETAQRELKGRDPDELVVRTPEGIDVKPLYTEADLEGIEHLGSIPGQGSFLRGPRATMYTNRPWTIRQYAGFSTAEESNAFYRANLAAGQMGLSVAFDLATHRGYDSDHPRVLGDVGKAGVAIDSVEDMKILFDGIPLDQMSVSMTMNGAVLPILALLRRRRRGARCRPGAARGHDPERHPQGVHGPQHLHLPADAVACGSLPTSSLHGAAHAAVQLDLDLGLPHAGGRRDARPRAAYTWLTASSTCAAHRRRARRGRLRARLELLLRDRHELLHGGCQAPRSAPVCGRAHAAIRAENPKSLIAPHALPDLWLVPHRPGRLQQRHPHLRRSVGRRAGRHPVAAHQLARRGARPAHRLQRRIARNTQLILAEETGVTRTIDPLAGSYYVEKLTADLADRARTLIAEIEEAGGMTKAIADGWPKLRIEEAAARKQARVDRHEDVVVGVNKYQVADPEMVDVLDIDNTDVRQQQVRRLEETRSQRNTEATEAALAALTSTAMGDGNLLAACVAAARQRATVGEMSDALEAVFERHRAETKLISGVYGAAYDGDEGYAAIASNIASFTDEFGRAPKMFVAKMGQDGHDRGARVIATAFADLGFDVLVGPLFQTPEEAVAEAIASDVDLIGVSSHAAGHLTLVPQLMTALKADGGGKNITVICGGVIPPKDYDELLGYGVGAIFGPGTNIPEAAAEVIEIVRTAKMGAST